MLLCELHCPYLQLPIRDQNAVIELVHSCLITYWTYHRVFTHPITEASYAARSDGLSIYALAVRRLFESSPPPRRQLLSNDGGGIVPNLERFWRVLRYLLIIFLTC
jgi:hypothetical protein